MQAQQSQDRFSEGIRVEQDMEQLTWRGRFTQHSSLKMYQEPLHIVIMIFWHGEGFWIKDPSSRCSLSRRQTRSQCIMSHRSWLSSAPKLQLSSHVHHHSRIRESSAQRGENHRIDIQRASNRGQKLPQIAASQNQRAGSTPSSSWMCLVPNSKPQWCPHQMWVLQRNPEREKPGRGSSMQHTLDEERNNSRFKKCSLQRRN